MSRPTPRKVQVTLPADEWEEILDALNAHEGREMWLLGPTPGNTPAADAVGRLSRVITHLADKVEAGK